MEARWDVAVAAENQLGEGVLWSPDHGEIQWTDILGRRFWAHRPADGRTRSVDLPDRLCNFAPLGGARLLAGFAGGLEVFDLDTGARRPIAAIEADRPTTRLNDAKLDRRGRHVFGTMDEAQAPRRPIGAIWSYEAGRAPRALREGVQISNSIAFSPDGARMYFADTPQKRILAFDYDSDGGEIANERVFAEVDGPGYPDGSTVDADGFLWNAEWGGARVVRYAPDGRIDRTLSLPCRQITCCAFGGEALDRLYVTSARIGLDAATLAKEPLAGALFVFAPGMRGLVDTAFVGDI
jgi:L-arabinonolactonase